MTSDRPIMIKRALFYHYLIRIESVLLLIEHIPYSFVVHVVLWRELHELSPEFFVVVAVVGRVRVGGFHYLEANLGERLCDLLGLLGMVRVGLDHGLEINGVSRSLFQHSVVFGGLQDLINEVHLLLARLDLRRWLKWNMTILRRLGLELILCRNSL